MSARWTASWIARPLTSTSMYCGNVRRQALDLDLAQNRLQDTALGKAARLADEVERHRHLQPLRQIDLVEVDVQDRARERVRLHLADQRHLLPERCRVGLETDEVRALDGLDVRAELRGVDGERHCIASSGP